MWQFYCPHFHEDCALANSHYHILATFLFNLKSRYLKSDYYVLSIYCHANIGLDDINDLVYDNFDPRT